MRDLSWPALPLAEWQDTCQTLHLWTQIVGKVRMDLSPKLNHWWHVPLYVNSRGLTTSAIPYRGRLFEVQFDFLDHQLEIHTSDAKRERVALAPQTVADFHAKVIQALHAAGVDVTINTMPQEIPGAIPFDQDRQHASYDAQYAQRFWRVLLACHIVLEEFRSRFLGKCSPVHFFWGSFDLACTRFSGRKAPPRKGIITSEAYSHEESSAGFWPGSGGVDAAFYAYTAPAPAGLENARVRPAAAFWSTELREFLLPYEDVRRAASPADALMDFLQSTYEAGANLGNWDREGLERI